MNSKRWYSVLVAVFTVVIILGVSGILASGSSEKPEEKFVIGFATAGMVDDLHVMWNDTIREEVENVGGTLVTMDGQQDIKKQLADVEDLLTKGVDVLLINPIDENGIVPAIEMANAKGIPVVLVDRNATGGQIASHIGMDFYTAGWDAGQFIAEAIGYKGKVAMTEGQAGNSVVRENSQGFLDALAQYPDIKVVARQFCDWDTLKAMSFTEDVLMAHPDLAAVFGAFDSMALGVVQAVKASGKDVVIVGQGLYGDGPAALCRGEMTADMEQTPEKIGEFAAEVALKLVRGEKVDKEYPIKQTIVTKETLPEKYGKCSDLVK